jgi:hypothetical protein
MDLVRPIEGGWLLRGERPGELEEIIASGSEITGSAASLRVSRTVR